MICFSLSLMSVPTYTNQATVSHRGPAVPEGLGIPGVRLPALDNQADACRIRTPEPTPGHPGMASLQPRASQLVRNSPRAWPGLDWRVWTPYCHSTCPAHYSLLYEIRVVTRPTYDTFA